MFYALTSAGPRVRCWNPSLNSEGFNTSRGAQQMLMYQKFMFGAILDKKKKKQNILPLENFGENASKRFFLYL